MNLMVLEEASFGYGKKPAAEGVSLCLQEGETLCIVGGNGSGKSTLMKGMLRLLRPLSGSIRFEAGLSAAQIGYLPQQSPIQADFPAGVREVLLSGFAAQSPFPFYGREQRRAADEMLERIGLGELGRESVCALSGGQRQRLMLGRALLAARRLLFLDEPAAAMDAEGVELLYSLLREEKQRGVTVVLVTHSARSLEGADRVLWMDHRPRFLGAPQELERAGYSLEGGSDHGNLG